MDYSQTATNPQTGESLGLNSQTNQWEPMGGMPADLYPAQTKMESGGNPNAVSPAGAMGLKQLMPATAANPGFGIQPVRDNSPEENMRVGNEYMTAMLNKYQDPYAASAAYNWGPGNVDKWIKNGANPADLPDETRNYANKLAPQIAQGMQQQQQNPAPPVAQLASNLYTDYAHNPQTGEVLGLNSQTGQWETPVSQQESQSGEFMKGVHRSIADTVNLMSNAVPALGKSAANELFGTDFDNKQDLKDYMAKSADINKQYPAQVGSISDIKSPSDVMPYLKGIAGENVAGLIPVAGEGYLGAKLMAPALEDISKEAVAKYIASDAAKNAGSQLTDDAARQAIQQQIAAKAGALTVVGAMAPQQMAGEYVNLMSKGQDDPMGAALIGGLEAGIYAMPGMEMMNQVLGKLGSEAMTKTAVDEMGAATKTVEEQAAKSVWQQRFDALAAHPAVQNAMKDAGYLGATGMASEAIGVLGEGLLGANPNIFSGDNLSRIVNSGISNAVGGGMVGGATGALHGRAMPDMMNLPGANKDAGTKRTSLETGEVQAPAKTEATQPKGQTEANLQGPNGETLEQANPGSTNLLNPSIMRPSWMSDEQHRLADRFGITTEDLHKLTDHLDTDDDAKAALETFFKQLAPNSDPKQAQLPLDFNGKVDAVLKQRPDLDRAYAEAVVTKQDQRNAAVRDQQLAQQGAKYEKDGTLTRQVSADALKGQPVMIENPLAKVGVHDNAKASKAVADLFPEAKLQRSTDRQADLDALQKRIDTAEKIRADYLKKNPDMSSPEHQALLNKSMDLIDRYRALEKSSDTYSKFQTPAIGNVHSDITTPIEVARGLGAIQLKPNAVEAFKPIIKELSRIVKEVAGKAAKFVPAENLVEMGHLDRSVLGAQFAHFIMTAMPDHFLNNPAVKNGKVPRVLIENAYHEAAHFLYNHVFSPTDKMIIRQNAEKLRPYFIQDGFLKDSDFDAYLNPNHPKGLDELFANAVGKEGAKRYFLEQDQMKGIPFMLRPFVKKIMDVYDKTRNMIRGATVIRSIEDLMHSTIEGKYATDHITDASNALQRDRMAQMATSYHAQAAAENDDAMDYAMKEAAKPFSGTAVAENAKNNFNGNRETNPRSMGLIGKYVSSFRWLADKYPMFTPAYNDFKDAQTRGRAFMQGFSEHLNNGFNQLTKADRYLVHNIMDAVSKSDGKVTFNNDGHALIPYDSSSMKDLPFNHAALKDGDIIPLKDTGLNKGIKALQDSYKFALDQKETYWREYLSKSFTDEGLPKDFTKADLEAAKLKLDPKDEALFKKKFGMLDSASKDLDGLSRMRKMEYVPRQRYGQHAYIVKHRATAANIENGKAGQTAALHTVENGFYGRQFDNNSLAKAQGNLKKYLARPDLYNVYDAKGRITTDKLTGKTRDISNPNLLTYDSIKSHYGLTGDNLAIMAGLLNSRDVDTNKYNQLRDLITTGINHDKFSRMFKASDKLDGYSQDWDRVIHSYATTSAHFLGNMEFNRNLPEYQRIYSQIQDDGLRQRAQAHFGKPGERGYINSGSSDFGTLRAINYLWCMGGNMSSLLVESLKVPTVTLGNLNQFRPNPLKNMATLGKYATRYVTALDKIVKGRSQFGGHLITPLHNEDFLNHFCQGDKEMAAFIKNYAANYGNITEASANRAFGGGDIYGSETGKSNFQSKTNKIQTWLSNPLSVVEQGNRLLSFAANYETMRELEQTQPGKLDQLLSKNQIYQDMRSRNPDWKPWQAGTMYAVDEENGAPGKIDRSPYLQGVGGAFVLPFFSFDHTALESMVKMFNRGSDGRKALGVMMGMFALTAGIQGLPGARLLLKGGQALQNSFTGSDPDWEQSIRESMAPVVGNRNSLMVTNGILRAYGGMEISQRISLPLPGEDLLLNLLGVDAGKTSDVLGVEGSMIQNASNAWRAYMNGQSAGASLGQMLPNSVGNIEKAYQLSQRGAMNNVGGNATRAVPPDQLSNWSVISRALGITSDQIASANEQIYDQKMKGKELQTADNRFTQQAAMAFMQMQDAQRAGDTSAVLANQEKLSDVLQAKAAFASKHNVPFNGSSFMNQLKQTSMQRQMPLAETKQNLGGKAGIFNGSIGTYQYFSNLRGGQ
jgi:hypothetical protein